MNMNKWTIKDLQVELGKLRTSGERFGGMAPYIRNISGAGTPEYKKYCVEIFTENHKYSISAHERKNDNGYLGCTMDNRKPRAGENHTRGRDCADGELCLDTWIKIMYDIIGCEMVPLKIQESKPTQVSESKPVVAPEKI